MAESELKIRVVTDAKNLNELRAGLKQWQNEMKDADFGSKAFTDAQTKVREFNQAIKESGANYESYLGHVKRARMEKRMLMFAITELMHGFDGLAVMMGGNIELNKKLVQGLQGAAAAGMGVKFAFDAVGGSFAKLAGPAGIVIGIITALANLKEYERARREAEDKLIENEIEILKKKQEMGLVPKEEYKAAVQKQIATLEERKTLMLKGSLGETNIPLEEAQKFLGMVQKAQANRTQILREDEAAFKQRTEEEQKNNQESIKHTKEYVELETKITDLKKQVFDLDKKSTDTEKKAYEEQEKLQREISAKLREGVEQVKEYYELHYLSTKQLEAQLKLLLLQAMTDKDRLYIMRELEKIRDQGINKESQRYKKAKKEDEDQKKKEKDTYEKYVEGPILAGIDNISYAWEDQFHKNLMNTFNQGKTVADQFFIGVLDYLMKIGEELAIKGIFSLLGMIPGMGFLGELFGIGSHAGGGWIKPGEVATVGEHGMEMAVGTNHGTYIYNNQQTMNHIRQYGGSGMQPYIQIMPIVKADQVAVMVKYGNQMRNGRVV